MPNGIYDKARLRLLSGLFNWQSMECVVTAWQGPLWFDPTDQTIAHLRMHGPIDIGYSLPMLGMLATAKGHATSGPAVIPTPPVGGISFLTLSEAQTPIEQSELILYIDTGFELPFFSNGLDVIVQPDWLAQRGWFRP